MKINKWLGAAVFVISSVALGAQQAGVSAQESASSGSHVNQSADASAGAHPGDVTASGTANSATTIGHPGASAASYARGSYSAEDMRRVSGELEGKLDSKTARVGDPVVLKTTEKMKTADGMVIPKGTKLLGHVTEVQARDSAHAQSALGLAFDHAELKNGQSLGIQSTIRSLGPSAGAMAAEQMNAEDSLDAPMAGGGASGGGRALGGRRLIGGAANGAVNTVAGTTAQAGSGLASTTDSALRTTGGVAGSAMNEAGAGAHVAGATGGGLAAHATGVPRVMLQSGASDSFSGVLSASKRNVHLESGTQMELDVVTAARQ